MRIGVICEGPSDFPAIEKFFGHALMQSGINPQFRPIFPELDRSRADGGWSNVLLWLNNHPPEMRVQQYFGGGLFAGSLSSEPLDLILIQLDADSLGDNSFRAFVSQNYNFDVNDCDDPSQRGLQITKVIQLAARCGDMSANDAARHVPSPAVESTETWCVAAFRPQEQHYEVLRGTELLKAFMESLERSEGREPKENYSNIDKSVKRRRKFCNTHAGGSARIVRGCPQFSAALDRIIALA